MAEITSADDEFVLICGVSPEAFVRIDELLGEYHCRFTYDRGTLEMYRVVHAVPPETYQAFMEVLSEHHLRHTYDGWTLEMMTPRKDHEWVAETVGTMIRFMALALRIPVQSAGSTTLSPRPQGRGLQPDKSYYVGREPDVRGSDTYRPGEDPPPDLVIEVDVNKPVVSRLRLYAQIGVPEIWHWKKEAIRFLRLGKRRRYEPVDRSIAFPWVSPADVSRLLSQRYDVDENAVIEGFVEWAREAHRQWQANPET
jgi:Uma2 family endonuclease